MRISRGDLVLAVLIAAVLVVAPTVPHAAPAPAEQTEQTETERIQAHLLAVEDELLQRDVSGLSPQQRSARTHHIQVLREYRERGLFPHNHDFPDRALPFFLDHQGTPCAVAYLLMRSGRTDLVERIARTRNHALVPELADEPELVVWLDSAGISLGEAARIQPKYEWDPPAEAESERVSTEYAVLSALSIGFGGVSIAQNLPGNRSASGLRGAYGILIGAYGIALGVPKLNESGAPQLLGVLNTAVGSTAALLGAHTLWQGRRGRSLGSVSPVLRADGSAGFLLTVRH